MGKTTATVGGFPLSTSAFLLCDPGQWSAVSGPVLGVVGQYDASGESLMSLRQASQRMCEQRPQAYDPQSGGEIGRLF